MLCRQPDHRTHLLPPTLKCGAACCPSPAPLPPSWPQGNPCCEEPQYRLAVLAALPQLTLLDLHEVNMGGGVAESGGSVGWGVQVGGGG